MNIPVATLKGVVTGSIDESIRHSITKLAIYTLPLEDAANRIIKLGERLKTVFNVGGSSLMLASSISMTLNQSWLIKAFGVGPIIDGNLMSF